MLEKFPEILLVAAIYKLIDLRIPLYLLCSFSLMKLRVIEFIVTDFKK